MTRIALLVGLVAAGCSSPASRPQTVAGRIAQATFPANVDGVRVLQGNSEIVSASVAIDGSFSIIIPAGTGYRIAFVSSGDPGLIFPRQTGSIETAFDIKSGTQLFDLGKVRFIGDPASHSYHQGTAGGDEEAECEDGVDDNGAVCVDDDDDEGAACEDGTDDGETNDDGGDGDGETDDDNEVPQQAAVAEHNLPSSIGCDDQDGEEEDD